MLGDARHHRLANGGWPEAATAGAFGVRLSGPGNMRRMSMKSPGSTRPHQTQRLKKCVLDCPGLSRFVLAVSLDGIFLTAFGAFWSLHDQL